MSTTIDAPAALKGKFPQVTDRPTLDHPAVNVPLADAGAALQFGRDELGYDLLSDVTAVDWADGVTPRFTVIYHLFSTVRHDYLRVAVNCPDDAAPAVPTVNGLWPAANWHEREVYDMFGITFTGHPDLRRILMWDGYPHFPLRKDFPLAGIEVPLPDAEVAAETKTKVLPAPMMGGPFVASSGEINLSEEEPRGKDESWNERHVKPE
jgi:NADH-quinone oxidoreductase subunit C